MGRKQFWAPAQKLYISRGLRTARIVLKDYVISRKNFLFVMHDEGGEATGIYASLIAIAKINALDPYKYITWILEQLPHIDPSHPEEYDAIMPWNAPCQIKIPEPISGNAQTKNRPCAGSKVS